MIRSLPIRWMVFSTAAGCAMLYLYREGRANRSPAEIAPAQEAGPAERSADGARAEVARLERVVSGLAASVARLEAAPAAAPARKARTTAAAEQVPAAERISAGDVVEQYRKAGPDPRRSSAVASGLQKTFSADAFASARVALDEVDCRDEVCKVMLTYSRQSTPEMILGELARAEPDSRGFHSFDDSGDRRRIVSYLLRRPAPAAR